jgi:L-lactate dehydrogenase
VKRRVGIIGTGWVGTSVAISILHAGAADELWLSDARTEVAEGEAMDLAHGATFYSRARVGTATVEQMADADIVVVAAGRGGKPGESRLDLLRDNVALTRELGRRLAGSRGTIVMVTNPVDVLTAVMTAASGSPPARVLGTGTMLDTARLRQVIGRELRIDPHSVHAHVVGEHGDSEVVLWSTAMVGGLPLRQWPGWTRDREPAIAAEVRTAAYEIIRRKGVTNHAIGLVTAGLVTSLLRDERRVFTVSRVQRGASGIDGIALSLPAIVGSEGAATVLETAMDDSEREALTRSAAVLGRALAEADRPL